MLIFLYDDSVTLIGVLREYEACITTRQMFEASTFDLKCQDYGAIMDAAYLRVADDDELYRVESVTVEEMSAVVKGRTALVDLESRCFPSPITATSTSGALIATALASFTGARATNLTAGSLTGGTSTTRTLEGKDAYEQLRKLAASDGFGLRCRMGVVDIIVPSTADVWLGDAMRNVGKATYARSSRDWANYAYVRGTYTVNDTETDITVEVDQTSGAERRELWMEARIEQGAMTELQFRAALSAEGAKALADTRKVEYSELETDERFEVGDVVWYFGNAWSGWLLCHEVTTIYENGVKRKVVLGEPPASIRKTLRRTR